MRWRRPVPTAIARSSDTGSKRAARCIAVRIAPITKAAPKTAADAQPRALRPRASASTPFIAGGQCMSIVRSIEVIAQSPNGFDNACQEAIREASKTLRGIQSFWIKNAECVVENDRITMYRVNGKISFLVEESK